MVAIKYIDTLQNMVQGEDTKTVYMPYEATGVLASTWRYQRIAESKIVNRYIANGGATLSRLSF
jgi:hypothetical protein